MSALNAPALHNVFFYMSKQVFTIRISKMLIDVKDLMEWGHIRHVPVVNEKDEVVGMVSHRDLLSASVSSVAENRSAAERNQQLRAISLENVMRSPVTTISPDTAIQEAARLMRAKKIGCLPVIQKGKLVGILTDYDLLKIVEEL